MDAKAYFEALAWACAEAERSILILGWDIDSRISLLPERPPNGDYWSEPGARPLADFLLYLLEQRPELRVHILIWDHPFLYSNERERKEDTRSRFSRHPRLHFDRASHGPLLISHHQKVVVIDDSLAFCGGLDITQRRWDKPDHLLHHPPRADPDGQTYEPFHDVQMAVSGEAARDLGRLFRERWGERFPAPPSPRPRLLWPPFVQSLMEEKEVGIVRTEPSLREDREVRESEALFLDAIRAARDYIYIENQYFTSRTVGAVLEERLQEEDPPEIVVLVRLQSSKWTEAVSVAVLRAQLLRRLQSKDKQGRLLVLCPVVSRKLDACLNLHSKVFISDNTFLRVGSSNLCGRSEGMDIECDLAVEAAGEEDRKAIRQVRDRLLAEHLGVEAEEVSGFSSMREMIRHWQGKKDRTLIECPQETRFPLWLSPSASLVDPESPKQFLGTLLRSAAYVLAGLLLLLLLAELRSLEERETLLSWGRWAKEQPLAEAGMVLLFFVLASLAVPLLPLAFVFALLLPPLETLLVSMAGALMSASFTYGLGRLPPVQRIGPLSRILGSRKIEAAKRFLGREGVWPLVLFRLLPVAPFWLENFCFGALKVRFRYYLFATFLALLPGLVLISYFEEKVSSGEGLGQAALFAAGLVLVLWGLQKGAKALAERSGADGSYL